MQARGGHKGAQLAKGQAGAGNIREGKSYPSCGKFMLVLLLSLGFVVGEIGAGVLSKSTGALTYGINLLTSFSGFLLSVLCLSLSKKAQTAKMTFGYHRLQLIFNLLYLFVCWVALVFIVYDAVESLIDQAFVEKPFMMLMAAFAGFLINILMYKLHGGDRSDQPQMITGNGYYMYNSKRNLIGRQEGEDRRHLGSKKIKTTKDEADCLVDVCKNALCTVNAQQAHCHQGRSIHFHKKEYPQLAHSEQDEEKYPSSLVMLKPISQLFSDMFISIGLVVSAILILLFGTPEHSAIMDDVTVYNEWHLLDPLSTFLFALAMLISTFPVVTKCYYLIMESVPANIDIKQLQKQFEMIEGVIDLHDLHVWELSSSKVAVVAHVLAKKGTENEVLVSLSEMAFQKRIFHSTFQVEEEEWKNDEQYILCHNDIH